MSSMPKTCPKCGSDLLMEDVSVSDTLTEDVVAQVNKRPQSWVFKGSVRVSLKATVCGSCGSVELYVTDPARLFKAYEEGR